MQGGWVCPEDGAVLEERVAALHCSVCGRGYAVANGVACFTETGRLDEHQRFEQARRERLVEWNGDRRHRYEQRVEREAVVRRMRLGAGDRLLDAGCGAGHITCALLASGAAVVALDFSRARLEAVRARAPAGRRLELVAADVTRPPLPPQSLTAIVCTQVLEHIPGAGARRSLLANFRRLLRPGGTLLLTVYNYSEAWRRRAAAREGMHNTGIFYHCYRSGELAAEMEGFEILELCGLVHLFPHTYRALPWLGWPGRALDHWAERRPRLSRRWGQLLLAHARRPVRPRT